MFSIIVLGVCAFMLVRGLVAIPLLQIDLPIILFLILGLLPIVVLSRENRERYLSFTLTIAGVVGILSFLRDDIDCTAGISHCTLMSPTLRVVGVGTFYFLLLVGGLWQTRETARSRATASNKKQ
jgi:hypothetical protein